MSTSTSAFLSSHDEKAEFNQYWYSSFTIETVVEVCVIKASTVLAMDLLRDSWRCDFLWPNCHHGLMSRNFCWVPHGPPSSPLQASTSRFHRYVVSVHAVVTGNLVQPGLLGAAYLLAGLRKPAHGHAAVDCSPHCCREQICSATAGCLTLMSSGLSCPASASSISTLQTAYLSTCTTPLMLW
jgi:hypothetical protein